MNFSVTLASAALMLLYAVPGFILVKTGIVRENAIHNFSKLLLYVCQPCLCVYSFRQLTFSLEAVKNLAICFALAILLQCGTVLLIYALIKKKRAEISWRIVSIAAVFSNCGFFGVPLLERLLPDHPEAVAYSCVFSLALNMLGWSLGMFVISRDKRYIKPGKIFLNPASFGFAAAMVFFFTGFTFPAGLSFFDEAITLLGRTSSPLCMIILGMRLAAVPVKKIFSGVCQYVSVALNQLIFPLFAFGILYFLPIDPVLKTTFVILCACPVASNVLNYAEILGEGQEQAANTVLLGLLTSILTVPLVCLIL